MNCSEDMIEAANERIQTMFAETAILLTHPNADRRALAKDRIFAIMFPAQGTEARRAETATKIGGSVHDGPVREANAPKGHRP